MNILTSPRAWPKETAPAERAKTEKECAAAEQKATGIILTRSDDVIWDPGYNIYIYYVSYYTYYIHKANGIILTRSDDVVWDPSVLEQGASWKGAAYEGARTIVAAPLNRRDPDCLCEERFDSM